ncbi:MAG TPA: ATP-binding protein [Elusimicrobiota bacterium]|nr:ATP-binding protein [Elusimicrobiota bacterium]
MIPETARRRAVYFSFQGLFMAVLLLLVVFQGPSRPADAALSALAFLLIASLVLLRLASDELLSRWWFQAGFFVGDAVAATLTLTLRVTGSHDGLFLLYLLLVFGSALTRSARQRLIVALAAIALYLLTGWRASRGWPSQPEFWLRAVFLAVSAALMAVLARDSRQAQDEQRRRYEERLVQIGRLATLGRVAGEVAHRIKGPLTTIAVDAEVLASRLGDDKAALKELAEISGEVERCKRILKDLLDLGRIEEMDVMPLDLREPVRAALKALASQARSKKVKTSSSGLSAPMLARGDATLLREAVAALLQNAIEASPEGGAVRVSGSTQAGFHRVLVADEGAGISTEDLERIFEPFFTTKKGEGSGLGLSAALRIAAKHGGSVEAESAGSGRGARFTLLIPAA